MPMNIRCLLALCSMWLASCADQGEALQRRCVEQFTTEETVSFVNVEGYCTCVMPKLASYAKANGIDLVQELNEKRFFQMALDHPEVDRITKECTQSNLPSDLTQKVVLSEHMKQSLIRKYALPLRGTPMAENHDIDGLCRCLVDSMNGNMTIGEFVDESFYSSPRYQAWVDSCKRINEKP